MSDKYQAAKSALEERCGNRPEEREFKATIQAALKSGQAAEKGLERAVKELRSLSLAPQCEVCNEMSCDQKDSAVEACWRQALAQPTEEL